MKKDQLAAIAHQFVEFEEADFHASPLGAGNINDTYRIDYQGVTTVLQRLNHDVFKDPQAVQRNARLLADHLLATDFELKIPEPIPTLMGDLLARDEAGNFWRMMPFFENTFSPDHADSPEIAFEVARGIGHFLKKLADFPADKLTETIPGFHDTARRWLVFEEILQKNPVNRLQSAGREIDSLLSKKGIFENIDRLKMSGDLPTRATHNDPKAANVLLDISTKKAVAVIDLDTTMPGTIPSDFGDMLRSFGPTLFEDDPNFEKMELNLPVVEAMCRGFLSETDSFLTRAERENLFAGGQWIVFEQALRFLTDYLAGDVYYRTKYANHNLVRAQNQLALLAAVGRHEKAIRVFLKSGRTRG